MLHPAIPGLPAGTAPEDDASAPLLAMEARLRDDADGTYRADLLQQLEQARRDVVRALDQGVPPDQYQRLTKVAEAIAAATRVVDGAAPASSAF